MCRSANSEYAREWRNANPEKEREIQKRCNSKRRDQNLEYSRQYRELNRERLNEYHRTWCGSAEQRAKARVRGAAWAATHREFLRERATEYRLANPEKRAAWQRARTAKKRKCEGSHSAEDVANQRKRQADRCFWCKENVSSGYHVDHVVPLSLGGSNGPENIVISCPSCNERKHAKHPMDWAGILL